LSFTLVSHVGYMVWGIALVSPRGLGGAIYYALHHIVVQTTLFLVAGLIERRMGTTSLTRLSGLAKSAPIVASLFFISGMNLVGVPPLTGFIGKVALSQASVEAATPSAWALLIGGIVTSFLTLYVVVKAWNMAFWQSATEVSAVLAEPLLPTEASPYVVARVERQVERARVALVPVAKRSTSTAESARTAAEKEAVGRTPVIMTLTVASLVATQILMTVFSGPIWSYVNTAAREQLSRTLYVNSVLHVDGRGAGISQEAGQDSKAPAPTHDTEGEGQ
ncbi:MAG: cation:proton antiporter, partial [Actinobacteria bacterium]